MFDILIYVYETYWHPEVCPEAGQLSRKLSAAGFETEEISDALTWLDGLDKASADCRTLHTPGDGSLRLNAQHELDCLGIEAIGYLNFLESAGTLNAAMRELVIERAVATGVKQLPLDQLKTIVLMVFWRLDQEPDALVLDELFVEADDRVVH